MEQCLYDCMRLPYVPFIITHMLTRRRVVICRCKIYRKIFHNSHNKIQSIFDAIHILLPGILQFNPMFLSSYVVIRTLLTQVTFTRRFTHIRNNKDQTAFL